MSNEQPFLPRVHDVKVAEDAYADLVTGRKTFEIRRNDRLFQVGDRKTPK